MSVENNNANRF